MDGVSLGLGVAGFAFQTYQAVVGCMEAIRNFRDAGDKNETLNCMLFVEQYRLMKWAQHCELSEGKLSAHLSMPGAQAVALMILRKMLEIIGDTKTLRTRYGLLAVDEGDFSVQSQRAIGSWASLQNKLPVSIASSLNSEPNIRDGTDIEMLSLDSEEETRSYHHSIKKGKTAMQFMRRCHWVVNDSKRFEDMIKQLRERNKSLERLVSSLMNVEIDILVNTPDNDLPALERATVVHHPALSNAVNIRARVVRHEPEGLQTLSASTQGPLKNLEIKISQLDFWLVPTSGSQVRSMATYQPIHGATREVLVEWRRFDSRLTQLTRPATIKRAESLAQILSSQPTHDPANNFRKLVCAGFFITDEHPERVGYVFELPQNANSSKAPKSLLKLLFDPDTTEDDRVDIDKPPLQDRLALSKALCKCVHYLHVCELVHKAIRSDSVLFFTREGDREELVRLDEPYITGFDHSRPDGPNDPTITTSAVNIDEDRYRHPAYLMSTSRRSTKMHDLYSLGLVLLEIAHWATLKSLVLNRTGDAILAFLKSEDSPLHELDHLVGSRYREIVERCIHSKFNVEIGDERSKGVLQKLFWKEIIAEILKCNV